MKPFPFARYLAITLVALSVLTVAPTAAESTKADLVAEPNPAAPGFLAEESDAEAVALADRVMLRLGGRSAWDATRFVTWKFFGNRFHVWDKHTGDIRIEGTDRATQEPYTILMNLNTKEGRAWQTGVEVTGAEALAEMLELGESAWINDAYWMFMPYKLKDTGLALKYRGESTLLDGRPADVLELTFREVGRTPENKYEVYVAKSTGLVEQWDFYTNASDESPRFQVPWRNWRRYGSILLSDDRGRSQHTEIAVFDQLPNEVFTEPDPVDLTTLPHAATGDLIEAPIYVVEGEVAKPRATKKVAPEYSESARKARITGTAVVRTVIGHDGSIHDAWITEKLEDSLDQAALDAVRQWAFEPATLNGEPVSVYYNLTINFRLDGDSPSEQATEESSERFAVSGGRLEKIWIKRAKRGPMDPVEHARAKAGSGLEGNANQGGRRQVTLISVEGWADASAVVEGEPNPILRRANLLVRDVDLTESRGKHLKVGEVEIRIYGETRPCRLMEESHPGLLAALDPNWRAGAFGEVLSDGEIAVGDPVRWVED